jgi:tRNA(fMet)-specific endonuclease VapC
MSFLVDTDTCSVYLKGNRAVSSRFVQHFGGLHVSTVTVGELYTWTLRAKAPPKRLQSLEEFLGDLIVVDVTREVARKFGELRAELYDKGLPPPDMDLLIAATALSHNLTLVTHNTRDFANIPSLTMVDWTVP